MSTGAFILLQCNKITNEYVCNQLISCKNKHVPGFTSVIAAINIASLTSLDLFLSLSSEQTKIQTNKQKISFRYFLIKKYKLLCPEELL